MAWDRAEERPPLQQVHGLGLRTFETLQERPPLQQVHGLGRGMIYGLRLRTFGTLPSKACLFTSLFLSSSRPASVSRYIGSNLSLQAAKTRCAFNSDSIVYSSMYRLAIGVQDLGFVPLTVIRLCSPLPFQGFRVSGFRV